MDSMTFLFLRNAAFFFVLRYDSHQPFVRYSISRKSAGLFFFSSANVFTDAMMEKRQFFNNMLPEMSVMRVKTSKFPISIIKFQPVFAGQSRSSLSRRLRNYMRANRRAIP